MKKDSTKPGQEFIGTTSLQTTYDLLLKLPYIEERGIPDLLSVVEYEVHADAITVTIGILG